MRLAYLHIRNASLASPENTAMAAEAYSIALFSKASICLSRSVIISVNCGREYAEKPRRRLPNLLRTRIINLIDD